MNDIIAVLGVLAWLARLSFGLYLCWTSDKGADPAVRLGVGILLVAVGAPR